MKPLYTLLISLSIALSANAQNEYEYDFNSLSIGDLDGQDNWVTILHTTGPADLFVDYAAGNVTSPDGTLAVFYNASGAGYGRTATRKATANFNFDFTQADIVEMEIDMHQNWWGMFLGAGFDADADGHIAPGLATEPDDGGIFFNISGIEGNDKITLPSGETIEFTADNSDWCRYKMVLDFTANNGEGAVALSFDPGITGEWIAIPEVQGLNMGLTPGSGDLQDRAVWDGIFFHSQGGTGGFDNILIIETESQGELQYIEFPPISNMLATDPPFELDATATSGLTVEYEIVEGPATIDGSMVTLSGEAGFVTISANQPGDNTWAPAPEVFQSFEVIDATAYTPELTIRRPADDTEVFMNELSSILVVASAYIDHPEVLNITGVQCGIDGQTLYLTEKNWNTGYYSVEWTPPDYGIYTMTVEATSTGGMISTGSVSFEVTNNISDMTVQAFDQVHISTTTTQTAEGDFVFPTYVGSFDQIMAYLDVTCITGGCDPWDRVGNMEAKGPTGEWVEIFRYITPYGVPCNHQLEVTDYSSIFQGLVEMRFSIGTNEQGFVVDVNLDFQEGTPQYKYNWVDVIWRGTFPFGDYANMQPMDTINWNYKPETEASKLKVINTGHGWGDLNTSNAAEFYEATHKIKVNDDEFDQHLWVDCNPNPDGCQPQNGTWYFDRAGWCPGMISEVYEYDLNSYINLSDVEIVYEFYPGYVDLCHPSHPDCLTGVTCADCGAGFNPHYIISGNLISYSDNLFITTGDDEKNHFDFQLLPNPTIGLVELTVSGSASFGLKSIEIINATGGVVSQIESIEPIIPIDMSAFPAGLYFVKINIGSKTEIKKIIVQ